MARLVRQCVHGIGMNRNCDACWEAGGKSVLHTAYGRLVEDGELDGLLGRVVELGKVVEAGHIYDREWVKAAAELAEAELAVEDWLVAHVPADILRDAAGLVEEEEHDVD